MKIEQLLMILKLIAFANLQFSISNFAIANLEMIFETRKFLIVNFKIWNQKSQTDPPSACLQFQIQQPQKHFKH